MVTEEEIAELLKTPEGRQILQSMWDATRGLPPEQIGASPDIPGATRGLPLEQIGASPDIPGATRGLPLEQIGASPDIPGATRGLPPKLSGINTEEENKLSRMGMQELLMRQW